MRPQPHARPYVMTTIHVTYLMMAGMLHGKHDENMFMCVILEETQGEIRILSATYSSYSIWLKSAIKAFQTKLRIYLLQLLKNKTTAFGT